MVVANRYKIIAKPLATIDISSLKVAYGVCEAVLAPDGITVACLCLKCPYAARLISEKADPVGVACIIDGTKSRAVVHRG